MMRTTVIILVMATALYGGEPRKDAADAVKKDLAHFQGPWQAVALRNNDGKPVSAEEAKKYRMVVKGKGFKITHPNSPPIEGTFEIRPDKKPMEIDVVLTSPLKDEIIRGIYLIVDENTRRSCFHFKINQGKPTSQRPKDFVKEADHITLEWKRVKKKL